jgi:hypothetical protein
MKEVGSWISGCNAHGCRIWFHPDWMLSRFFRAPKVANLLTWRAVPLLENAMGWQSRGRQTSMAVQRKLAILATLALTGCGAMPNISLPTVADRNNYKGKPLSALTARLGNPTFMQTISGQKTYSWRLGTGIQQCLVSVVMAGDIIESYNTSGDAPVCGPYEARQESSGSE